VNKLIRPTRSSIQTLPQKPAADGGSRGNTVSHTSCFVARCLLLFSLKCHSWSWQATEDPLTWGTWKELKKKMIYTTMWTLMKISEGCWGPVADGRVSLYPSGPEGRMLFSKLTESHCGLGDNCPDRWWCIQPAQPGMKGAWKAQGSSCWASSAKLSAQLSCHDSTHGPRSALHVPQDDSRRATQEEQPQIRRPRQREPLHLTLSLPASLSQMEGPPARLELSSIPQQPCTNTLLGQRDEWGENIKVSRVGSFSSLLENVAMSS
jgi:hypothetical protein